MKKIEEAQEILKDLGLPKQQQNKISALTLLALSGLKNDDPWHKASKKSLTLSKDIIDFVNLNYNEDYKANTRESFRSVALNPFIDHKIVLLNPDNPNLRKQSSKTHYALSDLALLTLRKFGSNEWRRAIEEFKKNQYASNQRETSLIRNIKISNYKSIYDDTIELGRINVFIGANGTGKTNILEAIAMVSASKGGDLDNEGLFNRGVRIAKPILTFSSFLGNQQKEQIDIDILFEDLGREIQIRSSFTSLDKKDIYSKWIDSESIFSNSIEISGDLFRNILTKFPDDIGIDPKTLSLMDFLSMLEEMTKSDSLTHPDRRKYDDILSNFTIYTLNTSILRGLISSSKKIPLGINGEGLDVLISNFNRYEQSHLKKCSLFFDWLSNVKIDKDDSLKLEGHKLGKSISTLYFEDKFMQKKNNIFSAENANEGILHFLFYLALFSSNKTPKFFAIDNIETALNPRLCRTLIKELALLAKETGKQVLITTHNPAILDGLNLKDNEQRLFEVYRNDSGMTKTRRIKFKEDLSDKKFKLSEMWMNGLLGAVPKNF